MIASLRGVLVEKAAGSCVIEASGVGYLVSISTHTSRGLPECGAEVRLRTRQVVREDALLLFGFADPEELSEDAAIQWNIVQAMELPAEIWGDDKLDEAMLAAIFASAEWLVDALFGTGLSGPLHAPWDQVRSAAGCDHAQR